MVHILKHRLLNVPASIWILQLIYVAIALGLFAILVNKLNARMSRLSFQILYVLIMIVINIIWRISIKKLRPGWF